MNIYIYETFLELFTIINKNNSIILSSYKLFIYLILYIISLLKLQTSKYILFGDILDSIIVILLNI